MKISNKSASSAESILLKYMLRRLSESNLIFYMNNGVDLDQQEQDYFKSLSRYAIELYNNKPPSIYYYNSHFNYEN